MKSFINPLVYVDAALLHLIQKVTNGIREWLGYSNAEISRSLISLYVMLYIVYEALDCLDTKSVFTLLGDVCGVATMSLFLRFLLFMKDSEGIIREMYGDATAESAQQTAQLIIDCIRIFFLAIYVYHLIMLVAHRHASHDQPTVFRRFAENIDFVQEHIKLIFLYSISGDFGPGPKKTKLKNLLEKAKEVLTPVPPLVAT